MAEPVTRLSKAERAKKFQRESKFAHNAFMIFKKACEIVADYCIPTSPPEMMQILDQMLHSILFLGNIHASQYIPEYIFPDDEILAKTETDFPNPFSASRYLTHVAVRTPFSYFLELVTQCYGQNNENRVKDTLSELLSACRKSGDQYPLISTVICICENTSKKYYGASLSCESDREREIMTALSCLHVWHVKVASAVMSVFPDGQGTTRSIKLPQAVSCRAYTVQDRSQLKPPCKRCGELYSLPGHTDHPNPPGNCAETEAISNLLWTEQGVDAQTTISGGVFDRDAIENIARNHFDANMRGRRTRSRYRINIIYKAQ